MERGSVENLLDFRNPFSSFGCLNGLNKTTDPPKFWYLHIPPDWDWAPIKTTTLTINRFSLLLYVGRTSDSIPRDHKQTIDQKSDLLPLYFWFSWPGWPCFLWLSAPTTTFLFYLYDVWCQAKAHCFTTNIPQTELNHEGLFIKWGLQVWAKTFLGWTTQWIKGNLLSIRFTFFLNVQETGQVIFSTSAVSQERETKYQKKSQHGQTGATGGTRLLCLFKLQGGFC